MAMQRKKKIGVLVVAVFFLLYISSPFILFPVMLAGKPQNGGSGYGSAELFNTIASPILEALEGDNPYYKTWKKYATALCQKFDGHCTGMQDESPADTDANRQGVADDP